MFEVLTGATLKSSRWRYSEKLVNLYQTAWRHIPENGPLQGNTAL